MKNSDSNPNVDALFVIPVFNQLHYTRGCLESLTKSGVKNPDIIVVDNASTDGTGQYLASQPGLQVVSNTTNLGCSAAWNQGIQAASPATWTIVMNNDVLVGPVFREGLVRFAEAGGWDIVSPAMSEGELDYDFGAFSGDFLKKMRAVRRPGLASGVCFMVHRRVFEKIGTFDPKLGQAGYEDEDFFRRASVAGLRLATTGSAWLHHFGSVTQKSVKAKMGVQDSTRLGNRNYFRKKHGLNWLRRRTERLQERLRNRFWRWNEYRQHGLTLHMVREAGQWRLL
jgi:N-acetylglucosaminyl-diphospho-decaprenol L-rhamnosyltransferase